MSHLKSPDNSNSDLTERFVAEKRAERQTNNPKRYLLDTKTTAGLPIYTFVDTVEGGFGIAQESPDESNDWLYKERLKTKREFDTLEQAREALAQHAKKDGWQEAEW